ncbi:MAG TPA: type 4a pilus biogenesis protein PilO, partial [Candidatus Hydrogenedentes bacterium]|nr:type 4a pilus biogenesis protein PilO [Candidatus Hydrogenedentota bacterium]
MRAQIARPEGAKLTIPYRIVVRGSFHDIAEFINRLERFKRYLKVSELQVGPEKDGVSEAEFTLSTYTFVENDTEGAA